MRQALIIVLVSFLLPACVSFPYEYRAAPDFQTNSAAKIAVGVQDRRPAVVTGDKEADFVGLQRGGYGNPFDAVTASGRPFAQDVTSSIVKGLTARQAATIPVTIPIGAAKDEAVEALVHSGAERLLLVYLNQWRSDTFVRTNLVYDLSAEVLDREGNVLAQNALVGVDFFPGSALARALADTEATLRKIHEQLLESLLNEDQITAALGPGASASRPKSTRSAATSMDHEKIKRFMRFNDKAVLPKLSRYNKAKKIGRSSILSAYKVSSVDAVKVVAAEGNRATVALNFTSGSHSDPRPHKYTYDIEINYSDVQIIGHRDFSSSDEQPQARPPVGRNKAAPAATNVEDRSVVDAPKPPEEQLVGSTPLQRWEIEKFFDQNERRARSGLRKYNEQNNIGQGGYYDDHRIMLINSVEVVTINGEVFKVKVGLSVGNLWSSTYFRYLYTARLLGSDLQVLDHEEL
jgi:hypothetical protein